MKIAAIIFGILGAIGALFLGASWYSDLNGEMGQLIAALNEAAGQSGGEFEAMKYATYALLAGGGLGLIASILFAINKLPKLPVGIALIVFAVLPLVFTGQALFGTPMALGGIFALLSKPKQG